MRLAPGMVRSLLLALGVVGILFVSGRFIGTREMQFELAHDPARMESGDWSEEERVLLGIAEWPDPGSEKASDAASEEGTDLTSEEPSDPASGRVWAPGWDESEGGAGGINLLLILGLLILMVGLFFAVSVGLLVFLFAPLFRKKDSRWRSPTMNKVRWAFIGSGVAAAGFTALEAHYGANLSLHLQGLEVLSAPPVLPDTYWGAYLLTLFGELALLAFIVVCGLVVVAVGLWAAGRRSSRSGPTTGALNALSQSFDG